MLKNKKNGLITESLAANNSLLTCLANDTGYENVFSNQLEVKANENDLLIALSGSGNSLNIVRAINTAKAKNIKTISILGYDGGICKEISDIVIHFPINDMQVSEDIQMIVFNICIQWIVCELNSKN